jgi:hypothetical protein
MNGGVVIYQILKSTSAVTDIVGAGDDCRVFPVTDIQNGALPFITFQKVNADPSNTKTGPSTVDEVLYQINIVAETPFATNVLAVKVREALDYATGTYEGVTLQQSYFQGERDGWSENVANEGACILHQDYKLRILTSFN